MPGPYSVPNLEAVRWQHGQQREAARQAVMPPAIGLICVATFGGLGSLAFIGLLVLALAIGEVDKTEEDPTAQVRVLIQMVVSLLSIANCGFSIWAAISMQRLQQHQLCWLAAVLACVPAIGPCFCLGIPFGV